MVFMSNNMSNFQWSAFQLLVTLFDEVNWAFNVK